MPPEDEDELELENDDEEDDEDEDDDDRDDNLSAEDLKNEMLEDIAELVGEGLEGCEESSIEESSDRVVFTMDDESRWALSLRRLS